MYKHIQRCYAINQRKHTKVILEFSTNILFNMNLYTT